MVYLLDTKKALLQSFENPIPQNKCRSGGSIATVGGGILNNYGEGNCRNAAYFFDGLTDYTARLECVP